MIFCACKRSGHHAIINWIAEQMDETIYFHNDIEYDLYKKGILEYKGLMHLDIYKGNGNIIEIYNFEDLYLDDVNYIARDYANSVASLIKSGAKIDMNNYYNTWIKIVETENFINYNKWIISEEYRKQICSNFNIKFTDKGFNKISPYGGGSSFVKMNLDTNENLLSRYKEFFFNDKWLNEMNRPKIKEYNKKYFNIEL